MINSQKMKYKGKEFHELSELAKFHLAPKLFGELAEYPFFEELLREERNEIKGLFRKKETPEELSSIEGKHLQNLLESVMNIQLREEAKNDNKEREKINRAKERIKEYVKNVLSSTKEYVETMLSLIEAKKTNDKTTIANSDDKRRRSHDALISNINILNRSLLWWFGKFDPDVLSGRQLEMYEKQEERFIAYDIERIDIAANGICPPSINVADRTGITRWATEIYKDLISIQNLSGI